MSSQTALTSPENSRKSLAEHLLTLERVLMGLILVLCGLSGLRNLLLHASVAESAAQVSGSLVKAGFMFPLLKGAEVLLQVWVNKARAAQG